MTPLDPAALDAILFDFDGVLTDNRVLVPKDGREAVWCNRADGLTFDLFRAVGMPVCIVSTETNPVVQARAAKLKVEALSGLSDKAEAICALCSNKGYASDRLMFVGNDLNDLGAMALVGYPVAVADAHPSAKEVAWHILSTSGAAWVAREIEGSVVNFKASIGSR